MAVLTRKSFQELALTRLDDADVLLRAKRFAAAFYLAGYVVECALKAIIARQTRRHEFPDKNRVNKSYTHKLIKLLEVAEVKAHRDFGKDSGLDSNWALVCNKWSEESRYDKVSPTEARDLLSAVSDPNHGVLQWLQRYW